MDTEMDPETPAAAFKRLQTSDQRHAALDALVRELSPYEWRALHATIAARSFEFDIIGNLPIEIVIHIFNYLDSSALYRLQRVSKQWQHQLMSLPLLRKNLQNWYDGALDLSTADADFCRRKALSVHAFQHDRKPDLCFKLIPTSDKKHGYLGSALRLVGHTLILTPLIGNELRSIDLFNFKTWRFSSIHGEAREKIEHVVASTQLVAFTTYNHRCYVFDLATLEGRKFHLLGQKIGALHCRERTVAYATPMRDSYLVYIWDYDTRSGISINLYYKFNRPMIKPQIDQKQNLAILVQPKKSRVIVFTILPSAQENPFDVPCIDHTIYSYNGDRKSYSCTPLHGMEEVVFPVDLYSIVPTDSRGSYKIVLTGKKITSTQPRLPYEGSPWSPINVQYDENLNKFVTPRSLANSLLWIRQLQTFHWKTIVFTNNGIGCYFRYNSNDAVPVETMGREPPRGMSWLNRVTEGDNTRQRRVVPEDQLVNDTYVVQRRDLCIYVSCYDHELKLPEESGTFPGIGTWEKITCCNQAMDKRDSTICGICA